MRDYTHQAINSTTLSSIYFIKDATYRMISKPKLTSYLIPVLQTARRGIKKFKIKGDARELHRLRISIKKIRALTLLFKKFPGEPGAVPVIFEMLKPLNRDAAGVRSMDIIIELLKKLDNPGTTLFKKSKRQRKLLADKLKNYSDLYTKQLLSFQKMITGYLAPLPDQFVTERCWMIISGINGDIMPVMRNKTSKLHKARKYLKDLIYIHDILPPKIVSKLRLNVKCLDRTQHLIGQWHDCVDIKEYLKKNNARNNDFRKSISNRQKKKLKELKQLIRVNHVFN